jgi:hypothetical protein
VLASWDIAARAKARWLSPQSEQNQIANRETAFGRSCFVRSPRAGSIGAHLTSSQRALIELGVYLTNVRCGPWEARPKSRRLFREIGKPVCTENLKSDHNGDEVRQGWRVI